MSFSFCIDETRSKKNRFLYSLSRVLVLHFDLDETLFKEPKEIAEDLIVAAHNDAKSKLKKKTSEEISKITGGIDLPPGFKLPF